jgi:hypothetical protein
MVISLTIFLVPHISGDITTYIEKISILRVYHWLFGDVLEARMSLKLELEARACFVCYVGVCMKRYI